MSEKLLIYQFLGTELIDRINANGLESSKELGIINLNSISIWTHFISMWIYLIE